MNKYSLFFAVLTILAIAFVSKATMSGKNESFRKIAFSFHQNQQNTKSSASKFAVSSQLGSAPFTVHFTAKQQTESDENVIYSWNFGDGEVATGKSVSHEFSVPGIYTTTLTTLDKNDMPQQYSTRITVQSFVPENIASEAIGNKEPDRG